MTSLAEHFYEPLIPAEESSKDSLTHPRPGQKRATWHSPKGLACFEFSDSEVEVHNIHRLLHLQYNRLLDFYSAIAKAYTACSSSQNGFLEVFENEFPADSAEVREAAASLFSQLEDAETDMDPARIFALVTTDGVHHLFNVLYTNHYKCLLLSREAFEKVVKERLGMVWATSFIFNVKIFYDLMHRKRTLFPAQSEVGGIVWAIQTAENTAITILGKGDELLQWAIDSFDDCVFRKLVPHSQDNDVAGYSRVPVMYKALSDKSYELAVRVSNQSFYRTLDESLGLASRVASMSMRCSRLVTSRYLLEQAWPQDMIMVVDRVLNKMHLKVFQHFLEKTLWEYLDIDQDGVVTIGDVYVRVRTFNPYKALYYFIRQYDENIHSVLRSRCLS